MARLGYLVAALLVLRVIWGFIGPEHARLANFVAGPWPALDYLAGLLGFSSRRYIGHSPAGAAMVIALLIMVNWHGQSCGRRRNRTACQCHRQG